MYSAQELKIDLALLNIYIDYTVDEIDSYFQAHNNIPMEWEVL